MKLKSFLYTILLTLISLPLSAQTGNCYRAVLTDKNNSPYSVSSPEQFLSQRAIDKRQRYAIPVTEEDLPVNPSYVSAIREIDSSIRILSLSKWTNTLTFLCQDEELVNEIRNLPFVSDVVVVGNYPLEKSRIPTVPVQKLRQETFDTTYYGAAYPQIALHNGHLLHNEGFMGEGMLIAVLDAGWTGFDELPIFQSLYENGQIWGTYNFIPYVEGVYSLHSHGTSCTSEIAVCEADSFVGAAPRANFFFIRTEDPIFEMPLEEDFWIAGAELADSIGADVISSSLGYTTFDDSTFVRDYSTCDGEYSIASVGATMASHRGIVVCVAAGNEGSNVWHKLSRPGDANDILCVGAVNRDSLYAPFSGCGPSYDGRVKPDVASCGWEARFFDDEGMVSVGNGTSCATPIIAGMSACLWQAMPQFNSLEIMQIIRECGHQYTTPDTLMGYGIPDFYRAWELNHTVGIDEMPSPERAWSVYPNPCEGEFWVVNSSAKRIQVEVYDMTGRLLYRSGSWTEDRLLPVRTNAWTSGVYIVKITDGDGNVEMKKLVRR